MIGQHVKFHSQGLKELPHVHDKPYRVIQLLKFIKNEAQEFGEFVAAEVHDFTHVVLDGLGITHSDHLNLPK